jgi:hypothetical protein
MADAIHGLIAYPALHDMFKTHGKAEVDNLLWKNSAKEVRDIYLKAIQNVKQKK